MSKLPENTFFFDIETTGFDPHRGSVLSISYGSSQRNVESLYSQPKRGARLSRWVEKNVWDPIQERISPTKMLPEKQTLQSFIKTLGKQKEGTTLAGWNIGYEAATMDRRSGAGFDIPFLMSRAEAYGLQSPLEEQLRRFDIRDLGQEYAARLAREVPQYKSSIEKNVFEQFTGYRKKIPDLSDPIKAARIAAMYPGPTEYSSPGLKIAGWKQEVMHKQIFPDVKLKAHISEEDVLGGLRLGSHEGPIFKSAKEASAWGRDVRIGSLVNQAISTRQRSDISGNKFKYLLEQASLPISASGAKMKSMRTDFLSQLRSTIVEQGGIPEEIYRGEGMRTKSFIEYSGPFTGSKNKFNFGQLGDDFIKISGKHKKIFAAGAVALGLYALKPGGWFSGKDDDFNVIEGLPHGGIGEHMRKGLTDFGSGWIRRAVRKIFSKIRGIKAPKTLSEFSISAQDLPMLSHSEILNRLNINASQTPINPQQVYRRWKYSSEKFQREAVVLNRSEMLGLSSRELKAKLDPKYAKELARQQDVTNVGRIKRISTNENANTIEGLSHKGISKDGRKKNTDFGSGWRGLSNLGKKISRIWHVARWMNKESNRAISNITKEIFHGAVKKQPLELGVVGATFIEGTHLAAQIVGGALTPGAAAMGVATFVATKYGYEAIKKRSAIKATMMFLKRNPKDAKVITKETAAFAWNEVASYVSKGKITPAIQYIRAGGGQLGKEYLLSSAESKLGMSLKYVDSLSMNDIIELSRITGKDDAYNVIQGLPENGIGPKLRKIITDFGSGWRGLLKVPASLEKYFTKYGAAAMSIKKADLPAFLKKQIATIAAKGGLDDAAKATLNKDMSWLVRESSKSKYDDVILANIGAMKSEAAQRGMEWRQYFKGTIKHERFHQALTQSGRKTEFLSEIAVPSKFTRQIKKAYKKKGVGISEELVKEEYLAHTITESYSNQKTGRMFRQGVSEVQRLEKTLSQSFLMKKHLPAPIRSPETLANSIAKKRHRKLQVTHQMAMVGSSKNAVRPGQRHRQKTGKIVQ